MNEQTVGLRDVIEMMGMYGLSSFNEDSYKVILHLIGSLVLQSIGNDTANQAVVELSRFMGAVQELKERQRQEEDVIISKYSPLLYALHSRFFDEWEGAKKEIEALKKVAQTSNIANG